jgi:ERCC4-type nuclease
MELSGQEPFLERFRAFQDEPKTQTIPFTIAIDTREQHPFDFAGHRTERATLRTGDYSILGMEKLVCVERKSKVDLFGSVTRGRERFERELGRMKRMPRACIVVECSMDEVRKGIDTSKVQPLQVINTAIAWAGRYRIPWFFLHDRAEAEQVTLDFLRFAWRDFLERITTEEEQNR